MPGRFVDHPERVLAVLGVDDVHLVLLEHARQREDVADVIVDDERPASGQRRIVEVELLEHPAFLRRQVALDAVEEQRGFVEQPVRRFHVLDDDCFRQAPELGFLFLRQILAGIDDDRDLRQPWAGFHAFEQLEAGHVVQSEIQNQAIEVLRLERGHGFRAACHRRRLDVAIADQFDNARPFESSSSTISRLRTLRSMKP